ncbi:hypothetical protein J7L18_10110 [Candidatus Bathyarchaeota archaeon]|nr:hypothetical protein [Candidatus Bathyarchaeota archaeon]
MKAILNATPLIYLGKKRRMDLLRSVFEKAIIPVEVEREITRIEGSPEAVQLRKAIHEGWIRVRQSSEDRKKHIIDLFSEIDEGEAAVIAVALEDEEPTVIVDYAEARVTAEYFGLDAHSTLYVILEAYRRGILKSKKEKVW